MIKRYVFKIDLAVFDKFNNAIKEFGFKKSPAISALMKYYNHHIFMDIEKRKMFLLTKATDVEGYGLKTQQGIITVEEVLLKEFLKKIKPLKQKDALEKMFTNFLQMTPDEQGDVLLG